MIRPVLQVILTLSLLGNVCLSAVPADPMIAKATAIISDLKNDVGLIVQWCERKGLDEEARFALDGVLLSSPERTAVPIIPLKSGILDLDKSFPKTLPKEYERYVTSMESEKPEIPDGESLTDKQIARLHIVALRQKYATELYNLSKNAVKNGRGALAMQLAMTALLANPDHAKIRNAFGFYKYKDEWRPAWEVARLKDGFIDHEKYGWIRKKDVEKFEAGQRFVQGKWVPAKNEVELRSTIKNGWDIETENYRIRTNHSLEEGVRLSRKLECLYRVWNMVFYRYRFGDAKLSDMLAGKNSPNASHPKYSVIFYRDEKDMFVNHPDLDPKIYQGGAYIAPYCVFCASNKSGVDSWNQKRTLEVMYHEATHQLFAETSWANSQYGRHQNYWIVEGAAMFMQSLRQEGTFFIVGEPSNRHHEAEREFLAKDAFLKTRDFTDVSRHAWVTCQNRVLFYRQADNMFKLLFYENDGYYRDRLIAYLQLVYGGKDTQDTFENILGIEPGKFDEGFKEFIKMKNTNPTKTY